MASIITLRFRCGTRIGTSILSIAGLSTKAAQCGKGPCQDIGWLPKLEYGGMETYIMVGDPAISVIADAYLRGIRGFDVNLAYEAMKHNATVPETNNPVRPGLDNLLTYGYIPEGEKNKREIWGSVSTAQEYCIADWNLAQMARTLGKEDDYKLFYDRSMLYKNYFDSKSNFVRPKIG